MRNVVSKQSIAHLKFTRVDITQ